MDERAVIEEAVGAWAAGDDSAFWRLLAEDVRYSVIGTTRVSGSYDGRRAFFEGALRPMGALLAVGARPTEYEIISDGLRVVLMWSGEGVMLNGAPYNNSYCWVLDVRDGRVQRIKAYLDTALVEAVFRQEPRES